MELSVLRWFPILICRKRLKSYKLKSRCANGLAAVMAEINSIKFLRDVFDHNLIDFTRTWEWIMNWTLFQKECYQIISIFVVVRNNPIWFNEAHFTQFLWHATRNNEFIDLNISHHRFGYSICFSLLGNTINLWNHISGTVLTGVVRFSFNYSICSAKLTD